MYALVIAVLTILMAACVGYQPPTGHGYDYDRGRAMARSDIRADRLIYYVSDYDADSVAVLSKRVETRCGFRVRLDHTGPGRDIRELEFAEGYNSVSVPAIEEKLGSRIRALMEDCGAKEGSDR